MLLQYEERLFNTSKLNSSTLLNTHVSEYYTDDSPRFISGTVSHLHILTNTLTSSLFYHQSFRTYHFNVWMVQLLITLHIYINIYMYIYIHIF